MKWKKWRKSVPWAAATKADLTDICNKLEADRNRALELLEESGPPAKYYDERDPQNINERRLSLLAEFQEPIMEVKGVTITHPDGRVDKYKVAPEEPKCSACKDTGMVETNSGWRGGVPFSTSWPCMCHYLHSYKAADRGIPTLKELLIDKGFGASIRIIAERVDKIWERLNAS